MLNHRKALSQRVNQCPPLLYCLYPYAPTGAWHPQPEPLEDPVRSHRLPAHLLTGYANAQLAPGTNLGEAYGNYNCHQANGDKIKWILCRPPFGLTDNASCYEFG